MISLEDATVKAGAFRLQHVSLTVPSGAYAVLMGATGCGKTTLLEAICGLRSLESGTLKLCGVEATRTPLNRRGVGYVPQDLALFPRMSVLDNLAFPLRVRGRAPKSVLRATRELAEELSISHLLSRPAVGLSGGESQRVALGRALAYEPSVLLLDEPLSSLDECARDAASQLLSRLHAEHDVTVLHVTHSRSEAERLAGILFTLDEGGVRPASLTPKQDAPAQQIPG